MGRRITIKAFRDKGARYYTWVRPDEEVLRDLCPPTLPHGGFVYLFHDDIEVSDDAAISDIIFPLQEVVANFQVEQQRKRSFVFVKDLWSQHSATPSIELSELKRSMSSSGAS